MINKVILIGNLGKDPEVRHLENGAVVARFPVATNESYRDKTTGEWQKLTEWHDVVVWRYLAERAERDLRKGSMIYVEGKLTHRKWTDRDGNDRYSTEVVASTFRNLDRKESDTRLDSSFPPESSPYSEPRNEQIAGAPVGNEAQEDDLPF